MSSNQVQVLGYAFKMSAKNLKHISTVVKKHVKELRKEIHTIFKDYISPSISKSMMDEGFEGSQLGISKRNPKLGKPYLDKLGQVYHDAWMRKYQEYITAHENSSHRSVPYSQTRFARYKAKNIGKKPGPPYMRSRMIKYTSETLATGFLRDDIAKVFKKRGSSVLEIDRSMAQIAWKLNIDKAPDKYDGWFEKITAHFKEHGIVPEGDVIDFNDQDWTTASMMVVAMLKDGPVSAIREALESFNFKA